MSIHARVANSFLRLALISGCWLILCCGALPVSAAGKIPLEALPIGNASSSGVSVQPLMVGEVPEVFVDLVTVSGGATHVEPARPDEAVVWLLVEGEGAMQAKGRQFAVSGETIARAPQGWDWKITARRGVTMQLVRVRRKLTTVDFEELRKFPEFQRLPLVKAFKDCTPYGEAIKSPKTVSRTLLPENYVPRMAMGTVETTGPDAVAPHRHAMLEQLFLGLKGNDITVTADAERTSLGEFQILHIPLGSFHGAQVEAGKKLHYVWMDFFADKAGQEWLKTHKPLTTPNTP
ncbi:MAG: hypothetical protein IT169_18340 [Bryobacterales bacterium]|nr:hypothetical protein [Bryobacterales bacterium]